MIGKLRDYNQPVQIQYWARRDIKIDDGGEVRGATFIDRLVAVTLVAKHGK